MGELRKGEGPSVDLPALHEELKFCLDNGMYGPRTGAALLWALELVEDLDHSNKESKA